MNKTGFFIGSITGYLRDIVASIMPLTAVMLPLVLGMAGVGFDMSVWMMNRRDLQSAADAAAIAAAWEIADTYGITMPADFDPDTDGEDVAAGYPEFAAVKEAENNGFNSARGDLDLTITVDDEGRTMVSAYISQEDQKYFSSILFRGDVYTTAAAASVVLEPVGDYCMLALEESDDSAFVINGNVDLDAVGCGLAANSSGDSALNINGGAGDLVVGDVSVVGGVDNPELLDATSITTGASAIPDPYQDLEIPDYDECTEDEMDDGVIKTAGAVTVYCGGLSVNGSLNLTPGVYIIDGGDLSVGNNDELTGEGVTIILTNSGGEDYGEYGSMDIKGVLQISAPGEDDLDSDWENFEGMAVYGDRNSPDRGNNTCHDMKGDVLVNGALYFPSRCLDIGGNGEADSEGYCSRIIATTIKLHGNPTIGNDCEGSGARDIGRVRVRLVM